MSTGLTLRHDATAPPGGVRRGELLDHHALEAACDGVVHERRRLVGVGRDDRRQAERRRHHLGEHVAPGGQRLVDEGGAVGMDHVEEVGGQSPAAPGRGLGAEVTHRVLEPARPAFVGQPGDLAVEHEIAARQAGDQRRRRPASDR